MPRPHPREFWRRAVELANHAARTVNGSRRSPGWLAIWGSPRRACAQAEIDAGDREALTSNERTELVELRRRTPVCSRPRTRSSGAPRRTSPKRTCSQNDLHLHLPTLRRPARRDVTPAPSSRCRDGEAYAGTRPGASLSGGSAAPRRGWHRTGSSDRPATPRCACSKPAGVGLRSTPMAASTRLWVRGGRHSVRPGGELLGYDSVSQLDGVRHR
jgi:transposase